ncbi:MAG: hypothetical protein M1837_003320 [Sclerophora amabilis]|nr:MAG: hypothetical protein M1837_003320 [Sclerophora amabilis]
MAPVLVDNAVSQDNLDIPLIDFSHYLDGGAATKQTVAQSVLDGFRNAGFIYLKNHGIPAATVQHVFSTSASFFARPQSQKDALGWTTAEANRGYVAHGREKVTSITDRSDVEVLRSSNPDLKESMEIGREDEPDLPNRWPTAENGVNDEEGKAFKETMKQFFDTCQTLNMQVMRCIALGMGIEESYFDEFTDRSDNTLRLLHYPSVRKDVFRKNKGQVRAGEHSDYGSITLLFQDSRGGLQVLSPKGTFVDATPIPDTIVINAGDLLERWSNDSIKSTKHRVVEPPSPPPSSTTTATAAAAVAATSNGTTATYAATDEVGPEFYPARYSIAYFCNPNFDKFIDALPSTWEKEGKKYPGINAGTYLVERLRTTY